MDEHFQGLNFYAYGGKFCQLCSISVMFDIRTANIEKGFVKENFKKIVRIEEPPYIHHTKKLN